MCFIGLVSFLIKLPIIDSVSFDVLVRKTFWKATTARQTGGCPLQGGL